MLFVPLFLTSCGDRGISEDLKNQLDEQSMVDQLKAFQMDQDVIAENSSQRFESLLYSSEKEECKSILFYYNDSLTLIREWKRNLVGKTESETSFYFQKGELYLVQDLEYSIATDGNSRSTEYLLKIENDKPVRAWFNKAENGYLDPLQFKSADIKAYSPNRAMDMFYNENDFVLRFDDFLNSGEDTYLLVNCGENKDLIAALKIENMDGLLRNLNANKEKFKNTPLKIKHQAINQDGWLFHYYVSGELMP